jgi:DNA polymerase type B, organellar and viral
MDAGSRKERKWLQTLTGKPKCPHKNLWNRAAACVNVVCPKKLNVPFLMERTEKGEILQTLYDKMETWYTGPELWEAVKLGYQITRIHEVMVWEESASIFDEFVREAYAAKSKATKDTPLYTCSKTKMNALTGKFAQKFIEEGLLFVRKQSELEGIDFYNLTSVQDEQGRILGWIASIKNETTTACYPVHLSCFILGHSRCFMSRILRNLGATTDINKSPLYSDTDSWIIKKSVFDTIPKKRVGPKLGQLKSEVDGKIIYFCALAPKTYILMFVVESTLEVKCRVRCKGIPHPVEDYDAFDEWISKMEEKAVDHYNIRASGQDMSGADIKERNYFFTDKEGNLTVTSRIPANAFPEILKGELKMESLFGAMERIFKYGSLQDISIAPTFKSRTIYKTPWWKQGKRIYLEDAGEYDPAYPPGHESLTT